MSAFGGCLVCGVVLSATDGLLCGDCRIDGQMQNTGALARFVKITDDGPIDVSAAPGYLTTPDVEEIAEDHVWSGPSHSSEDGLGECSCGDDDCEIATLLSAIRQTRAALGTLA